MTVYLVLVFTLPRVTDLFENLLKATYPCPHLWCRVPHAGVGHHGRHGTNSRVRGLPRASVRRPWAQNGTLRGLDPCPSPHAIGDTGVLWMLLSHHPERQPLCYLKKITDSHWSNRLGKISGQRMTLKYCSNQTTTNTVLDTELEFGKYLKAVWALQFSKCSVQSEVSQHHYTVGAGSKTVSLECLQQPALFAQAGEQAFQALGARWSLPQPLSSATAVHRWPQTTAIHRGTAVFQ